MAAAPARAKRAQHLDRVGTELDAGADFAELRRALVDDDFDAVLAQAPGRRKSAEARSDDRHADVARHANPMLLLPQPSRPVSRKQMPYSARMKQPIRSLCAGLLAALLSPLLAHAEFPDRTVKIVVPFDAGGSIDTVARALAQRLNAQMGTCR